MNYISRFIIYCFSLVILLISVQIQAFGQVSGNDLGLNVVVIDPGHGGKDPGALGKTRATDEKHVVCIYADNNALAALVEFTE